MSECAKDREEARLPQFQESAGGPKFAQRIRRVLAQIGGIPETQHRLALARASRQEEDMPACRALERDRHACDDVSGS